MRPDRHSN
uniref:Mha1 n=1 Tax=Arundo donax TaxID=35708 RepID=A0A0A9AZ42_ARUDO